jgi:hypothetical protein
MDALVGCMRWLGGDPGTGALRVTGIKEGPQQGTPDWQPCFGAHEGNAIDPQQEEHSTHKVDRMNPAASEEVMREDRGDRYKPGGVEVPPGL